MQNQKIKSTNRKFYNKWLYKVTLTIKGCVMLRSYPMDMVKEFCLGPEPKNTRYSYRVKEWRNREEIYALCVFLENHDKTQYATRIERDNIDLYTNDVNFYNLAAQQFASQLKHCFEPAAGSADLLNLNKNCITVKKLPKDRYNYRVYLLPHKMANDRAAKIKYIDWLKTQQPRVTCTESIEKWFLTTDWNWDRRYVLVEDEQTLLMMKLRNAEVVGRIYNFMISDK
jgi:hypothetical protein